MVVFAFYIFDRHGGCLRGLKEKECANVVPAECIYKKNWQLPAGVAGKTSRPSSQSYGNGTSSAGRTPLTAEDDAKLIFGTVYSLRNMVRKLGGEDDRYALVRDNVAEHELTAASFLSYRTSQYKLHYYETPTNTKFVMLTDIKSGSMRLALQQIYVNCYVEYVVKNPLSPVEHPGGIGVNNELFELSLSQFVVRIDKVFQESSDHVRIAF
jgi:trafficking protein particle complex subunit 1